MLFNAVVCQRPASEAKLTVYGFDCDCASQVRAQVELPHQPSLRLLRLAVDFQVQFRIARTRDHAESIERCCETRPAGFHVSFFRRPAGKESSKALVMRLRPQPL